MHKFTFLSYLSFVHVFVNCVHLFGISLNLELFFFESKLFGVLIHFLDTYFKQYLPVL